ncbi:MAG: aldo/keto reductase [Caldilinea sp.]
MHRNQSESMAKKLGFPIAHLFRSLGPLARLHENDHGDNPVGDKQEMISFLHSAVDRGITFFDTAEVYGPFTNKELLGEALSPFRGQVMIATKFGFIHDPPKRPSPTVGLDSRPGQIKQIAEASLKRLKVDAIDLFYQHQVDPNVPIVMTTVLPIPVAILDAIR